MTMRHATIFKLLRAGLSCRQPQADQTEAPRAGSNEDHSWHGSSFELARGLEVIEHCAMPPAVFSDPPPALPVPRA